MPEHPGAPGSPAQSHDWTVSAADTIESAVGLVRDKAVKPLTTVTRAVVFGLVAAIVGAVALVLVAILWVRVLDIIFTNIFSRHRVWVADAVTGGIFVIFGALAWRKRVSPS